MSSYTADKVYELLPAIYRIRDADLSEPLKALLSVIAEQARVVESDIGQLYDNWFIETCQEWVAPYIGDLLGVRGLHPVSDSTFSQRAQVANTISYRRRKGTATMLEQLAHDTTGWNARAVEFFELLATTQHFNHIRLDNLRTPDLRQTNQLELIDTPFDIAAHTADVRHIAKDRGKHNIPNIGIFLWRLQAYPLLEADAFSHGDGRFSFSPLGNDMPLFNQPQTETEITHLAEEINVPDRLRRRPLYDELEALREAIITGQPKIKVYFNDTQPVLQLFRPDLVDPAIPPEAIVICNLSDWRRPPPDRVGVDPVLGRIAFPTGVTPPQLKVSYAYGFSGDIGGGPYERRQREAQAGQVDTIAKPEALDALIEVSASEVNTLTDAINSWDDTQPGTVIQIEDNRTYAENLTIAMTDTILVIQAKNGQRPVVIGDITITGGAETSRLTLNGLLIAGQITVQDNLAELNIEHCTLVPGHALTTDGKPQEPGRPSIDVSDTNDRLNLTIDRSIVGPIRLSSGDGLRLVVRDSIVDSPSMPSTPTLVSGNLAPFPTLTSGTPTLDITIGDEGPFAVTLASVPTTLAQARDELQTAIQDAHTSLAFTHARVITAGNRLAILSGVASPIVIADAGADPTATGLRLDAASVRQVDAFVSRALSPFPTVTSSTPKVNVTIGTDGPFAAELGSVPTTLAQARDTLQDAIRNAHAAAAFTGAIVLSDGDQLIVLPGVDQTPISFAATADDQTTWKQLGLESDRPAIAASDDGEQPGPITTLERVTIFGSVHVKELELASDVIFTQPVIADRRQAGCVRFSYVPDNSRVPRRYHCQPDFKIQQLIEAALKDNPKLTQPEKDQIGAEVRTWLRPSFTDRRYGQPAYAQLRTTCPFEIRTGADNEAEMGAFNFLLQPQREANLRTNLDEYLRFGLEAGIFYAT